MSKFHVGDRVRTHTEEETYNNLVGVVQELLPEWAKDTEQQYGVQIEGGSSITSFDEHELRPADIVAFSTQDELDSYVPPFEDEILNPVKYPIVDAVDVVNHPPHYNRFPVEVINITEQLDFNRGNAVKYLARAGFKEGVDELEDLSKAAWYVNRAIEKLKREREDG